jgi:hypothetical protein
MYGPLNVSIIILQDGEYANVQKSTQCGMLSNRDRQKQNTVSRVI